MYADQSRAYTQLLGVMLLSFYMLTPSCYALLLSVMCYHNVHSITHIFGLKQIISMLTIWLFPSTSRLFSHPLPLCQFFLALQ